MEELYQPSLNSRGGPIAPISIQATNFGLKNDMIQQVQNSCQFHGLPGDDANKHLDKFLHVTQSIKVNGMAKMFLGKYFPPSMVTKLKTEITNFRQRLDESLFEAWECYKLSIDRCHNHNMLPVTQIDTFYNGLTLRHRDTINAAAAERSESSSSITSSSNPEIAALKAEMAKINKNLMRVLQNVYAAGAYEGGNSYQPQGNHNLLSYRSDNYLGPPGFNQNQNPNNQNQNFQNQNRNQGNNHGIPQGNKQRRNQFFQGASHGQNPPPAYQAPASQAPGYQALVHQPLIPQSQVVTTTEFTNYMKANDAILKNMQTNMTLLTNSNLELKNMFSQFMKMNIASCSGSGTLPSNTITNPKEDLKGITTRSGTAYQGPTIPTTSSSLPRVVECEIEVTKDMVPPTNNRSTKDVQPSVVQIKTSISNSKPVVAPIIEPVAAPVSALKPNQKPSIPYPRSFLKTGKSLIGFYEGELTLRVGKEAITFNLDQTSRYLANYNDITTNRINVIDTLTPFGDSDFLPEEVDAFLALEDDPTSPESIKVNRITDDAFRLYLFPYSLTHHATAWFDRLPRNSINTFEQMAKMFLGKYFPPSMVTKLRNEITNFRQCPDKSLFEAWECYKLSIDRSKNDKSSIDEPPEVELKDLPPHLEYVFLETDDKLPFIIAKDLSVKEKSALIKVLKSHKQAIAWILSDVKGINPEFCTYKILIEDDFEPAVQH
nr:hypothetical protein [Tanacetum cinerariifolium]